MTNAEKTLSYYETLIEALEKPDLQNPVIGIFASDLEVACHHSPSEISSHHNCQIKISSDKNTEMFYYVASTLAQHPSTYWQMLKTAINNGVVSHKLINYVKMLQRLSNL